jgi:hypothetical protein
MMAETWSGDDDKDDSDKEKDTFREDRNKYLMAKENWEKERDDVNDEIYDLYVGLHKEFKKNLKKIVLLSKKIIFLDQELKLLKTENESLVEQTNMLITEKS